MKRIVLDASAVMTFFRNRPGADKVEDLIHLGGAAKHQLLMSVVNETSVSALASSTGTDLSISQQPMTYPSVPVTIPAKTSAT
jgi:PIN domain nuclease of toxin-antitoxin system